MPATHTHTPTHIETDRQREGERAQEVMVVVSDTAALVGQCAMPASEWLVLPPGEATDNFSDHNSLVCDHVGDLWSVYCMGL